MTITAERTARTGATALIKEARRRHRRRRWLATAVVIATAAAGVATLAAGLGGGGRPRPPARHGPQAAPARRLPAPLAHAAALSTVSQTSLPEGNSLTLAVGYGAVWVTGVGVTYQVNAVSGRIVRTISTPGTFPDGCRSGIAAGAGGIWVTHGCRGVYRIDPHTGRVTASLRVPDVGNAITIAGGLIWATSYDGDLLRIQPGTNKIIGRPIPVGDGDWTMITAAGAPWVLTVQGSLVLLRIDPSANHVTGKPVPVGAPAPASQGQYPTAIASGPTGLWVLDFTRNRLFHMASTA